MAATKRLYRSRDAYIGGVCAGIADYFDIDRLVVRILAVLLACTTFGAGIVVYIVMWAVVPREPRKPTPYDVTPVSDSSEDEEDDHEVSVSTGGRIAMAAGLVVLYVLCVVVAVPLVPGSSWQQFWPVAVMLVGLFLFIAPFRTKRAHMWHMLGLCLAVFAGTALPVSLGILSWETFIIAAERLWFIVLAGVVLFVIGAYRNVSALLLIGAMCVAVFFVLAVTLCPVPGEIQNLVVALPRGHRFVVPGLH